MKPELRKLKKEDALELAHNIAVVWSTTYKGIVDDEYLEKLFNNEQERAEKIRNSINDDTNYYVLTLDNKIIGWVYFTFDSEKLEDASEIEILYVLKEYQGNGYGKLLYNFAIDKIKEKGIKKLVIGCLDGNPSNKFYIHMGGKLIDNSLFKGKYLENIYLFEL